MSYAIITRFCSKVTLVLPHKLPLWRSPDPPGLPTPSPDNSLMHSRLNTVVHLQVQFWQSVLLVGRRFLNITEGWGIHNVSDNESFDSLIFRDSLACGGAPDCLRIYQTLREIIETTTQQCCKVAYLTRLTCPRPCLFLPWLRLLTVMISVCFCFFNKESMLDNENKSKAKLEVRRWQDKSSPFAPIWFTQKTLQTAFQIGIKPMTTRLSRRPFRSLTLWLLYRIDSSWSLRPHLPATMKKRDCGREERGERGDGEKGEEGLIRIPTLKQVKR